MNQHEQHPHLSPQTDLRLCGGCLKLLPISSFRLRKDGRKSRPDYLCADCRHARDQARYQERKRQAQPDAPADMPAQTPPKPRRLVITEVADRDTRIPLIKQALQRVRESIQRRRRREEGGESEEGEE
jgi:hypothetical protein